MKTLYVQNAGISFQKKRRQEVEKKDLNSAFMFIARNADASSQATFEK